LGKFLKIKSFLENCKFQYGTIHITKHEISPD